MSVIFKGYDKPSDCFDCKFTDNFHNCLLQEYSENTDMIEEQYELCPLIQIERPHGELVDIDEIIKNFERVFVRGMRAEDTIVFIKEGRSE